MLIPPRVDSVTYKKRSARKPRKIADIVHAKPGGSNGDAKIVGI